MASILSANIHQDLVQSDGRHNYLYRFELQDNNSNIHIEDFPRPGLEDGFDTDADMLALGPIILTRKAKQEQDVLRTKAAEGEMALHYDAGGYFAKLALDWDTWDNHTASMLKYFLSREDQLELIAINLDVAQISNTDMRTLLDITNQQVGDIRGDIQVAINTRNSLNAYIPYFDEDGTWNR